MTKKRIAKILVCVVCLVAVLGYGVYAYRSWRAYQQEKEIMASGETSENIELFHDQGDIYMSPVAPTEKDDVTIRMRCGRYNTTKESKIGVILGGSFGRKSGYGGMSIMYDYKTGVLEALEGEESLGKAKLANAEGMKSLSLMVVYRDGKYDIYANQSSEPVLTAETKKPNGGGVSLYSSNSSTLFYNVGVCDITGTTNVEECLHGILRQETMR